MTNNILEEKIYNFTDAVRNSLENKNWYAALTLALTLPDICGRLEFPDKSSSKRFIHWFNDYLLDEYTLKNMWGTHVFLNGEDAYALRCAYLHQGEVNIEDQRVRKVLSEFTFVIPPENGVIHRNQINNLLQLQVDIFCLDICNAIEKWVNNVSSEPEIQKRAEKLMIIQQLADNSIF
jgi:hypothetical protein